MKGTSKLIMAATLVMVVSLALVFSLILVLLAELYCSLLLRRRRSRTTSGSGDLSGDPEEAAISASAQPHAVEEHGTPLRGFYAPGVIQAPRSLLFPAETAVNEAEKPGVDRPVYISNPVFENAESTPFETPESSPSRLDGEEEEEEEDDEPSSPVITPPLTPMKKLPAEACSVSLRDARSLATSESETNSVDGRSSSSSGSPRTSPSW